MSKCPTNQKLANVHTSRVVSGTACFTWNLHAHNKHLYRPLGSRYCILAGELRNGRGLTRLAPFCPVVEFAVNLVEFIVEFVNVSNLSMCRICCHRVICRVRLSFVPRPCNLPQELQLCNINNNTAQQQRANEQHGGTELAKHVGKRLRTDDE